MASKEKRKSGTECEGQTVSHINCNPFGQQKVLDVEKIEKGDTENLKRKRKSSKKQIQEVHCQINLKDPLMKCHNYSNQCTSIKLVLKKFLKTCRWCHFKKRSCALNRINFTAFHQNCYVCNKKGHFPKSINCKKSRKLHSTKNKSEKVKGHLNLAKSDIGSQSPLEKLRCSQTDEFEADSPDESTIEKRFEHTSMNEFMLDLINDGGFVQIEDSIDEAYSNSIEELGMPLFLEDCSFSQLDGFEEESFLLERVKSVYGISCEAEGIRQLINFLRSFNFLWISMKSHPLCVIDEECFFCNIRSSALRLRIERRKGPLLLKLNEFICHIIQYKTVMKFDILNNLSNTNLCIENTLKMIEKLLIYSHIFQSYKFAVI